MVQRLLLLSAGWLILGSVAWGQLQPLRPTNDPYAKNLRQMADQELRQVQTQPPQDLAVTTPLANARKDIKRPDGNLFEAGEVVALVGGEPILVGDMILEINQLFDKLMPGASKEQRDREFRNAVKMLAPKYIDAKLLFLDSLKKLPEKANVKDILEQAGKEFDAAALPKILEKAGAKSSTEYDAVLRSKGSSLRQMRDAWSREQLISYFVIQNLEFDKDITHEQLLKYYQEHRAEYHRPARVRWEEIMVRFDKFPSRDAAYQALVAMGNEVVFGARLDAVAKRSSQGLTASAGGQHDWTTKGSLAHPNLDAALFSIPLNELSEMIETKFGVHIVRVLEREQEHDLPFTEVQGEIKDLLLKQNRSAAIEKYLEQLRADTPVKIEWEVHKQRP